MFTNPTYSTAIGTCIFLFGAFIIIAIKTAADLRHFRNNLKPGDYARILIDYNYYRAKLVKTDHPFYKFRIIDTNLFQVVIKSKIYQP